MVQSAVAAMQPLRALAIINMLINTNNNTDIVVTVITVSTCDSVV